MTEQLSINYVSIGYRAIGIFWVTNLVWYSCAAIPWNIVVLYWKTYKILHQWFWIPLKGEDSYISRYMYICFWCFSSSLLTYSFIFFTEWSPSLSRANLDGTNHTILVSSQIYYPSWVTLDLPNEHVYWIDIYKDFIERVNYEGGQRWSMKKTHDVSSASRHWSTSQ